MNEDARKTKARARARIEWSSCVIVVYLPVREQRIGNTRNGGMNEKQATRCRDSVQLVLGHFLARRRHEQLVERATGKCRTRQIARWHRDFLDERAFRVEAPNDPGPPHGVPQVTLAIPTRTVWKSAPLSVWHEASDLGDARRVRVVV